MGQLLMTMKLTDSISAITLPAGFRTHQYRRGADTLFSFEDFRSQWIGIRDQNHGDEMASWFKTVYYDPHVPDDGFFLVVKGEKEMAASACIQIGQRTPDSATLHAVYTSDTYRGLGLGRAVVQQVINYAIEHGIHEIFLTTDDWRVPAIALYLKMGFIPVFYEPDMRSRWTKICIDNGFKDIPVISENGVSELINVS